MFENKIKCSKRTNITECVNKANTPGSKYLTGSRKCDDFPLCVNIELSVNICESRASPEQTDNDHYSICWLLWPCLSRVFPLLCVQVLPCLSLGMCLWSPLLAPGGTSTLQHHLRSTFISWLNSHLLADHCFTAVVWLLFILMPVANCLFLVPQDRLSSHAFLPACWLLTSKSSCLPTSASLTFAGHTALAFSIPPLPSAITSHPFTSTLIQLFT